MKPSIFFKEYGRIDWKSKQILEPVKHGGLRQVIEQGTHPVLDAARYQKLWSLVACLSVGVL